MKAVVLDVEGTVCSIAFVKEVLYPFAIKKAAQLLQTTQFPLDSSNKFDSYLLKFPSQYQANGQEILEHMEDLTRNDIKAPYLKGLQGYLWRSGYESGEIKVNIFEDADAAIRRWSKHIPVYIYSSGSIEAQKLLFTHTEQGDLTPFLSGYFDTQNAGPKQEAQSYTKITEVIDVTPAETLFFSDNPKEITAANSAGWQTIWTVRPGNEPVDWDVEAVTSFKGI